MENKKIIYEEKGTKAVEIHENHGVRQSGDSEKEKIDKEIRLEDQERIDDTGFGNLRIIQKKGAFCYGVDAVILSDFAVALSKNMKEVVDLGTSTGIIPLIVSHKCKSCKITGVELQPASAERAKRNVILNNLEDRVEIVNSDILDLGLEYTRKFDTVITNPPYMVSGRGLVNWNNEKMIARHETTAKLEDFFRVSSKIVKEKGNLFMVHRPSRLPDLITLGRKYNFELKTMQLVVPKPGGSANIVLLHYSYLGGKELKVLPELPVHLDNGEYSPKILEIYEKFGYDN